MNRFFTSLLFLVCWHMISLASNGPVNFRRACLQSNDSDVVLTWVPNADPCAGFTAHYIYARTDSLVPYTFLDSVTSNAVSGYTHKGANQLSNFWQYYVVTKRICGGPDSLASDTLRIDFEKPSISQLDSVSIDINSDLPIISWLGNTTPDYQGTIVFKSLGSVNQNIGSTGNTLFYDSSSTGFTGPHRYTTSAFDSCFNRSPFSAFHQTIKLNGSFDPCTKRINLNWNAYEGWAVTNYQIWVKEGQTGNWNNPVTVPGTIASLFLQNTSLTNDTVYCYVRAFRSGGGASSTSSLIKFFVPQLNEPSGFYLRYVTVTSDSAIEIAWTITDPGDYNRFRIYKGPSPNQLAQFQEITIVPGQTEYLLKDVDVKTGQQSYSYRVACLNPCNIPNQQTLIASSILLHTQKEAEGNVCSFNPYDNFESGVEQHIVYRGTDINGFTWNSVVSLSPTATKYEDKALPDQIGNTGLCYYIEATELAPGTKNVIGISRSNISCVLEDIRAFFPTAFVPDGTNNLFGPKGLYIDHARSSMEIYNRWGQRVFSTPNTTILWDGNMDGKPCPDGVYLYRCTLYSFTGQEITQEGTLHLIR